MRVALLNRREIADLRSPSRIGFTLIELAVVILVILILLTLTVALVGDVIDGDRVKGASRQVQTYLAGARDRAIYAASRQEGSSNVPPAIGVRFLPDPALNQGGTVRGFGSMVFVRQTEPLRAQLRVVNPNTGEVSQLQSNGQTPVSNEPDNHAVGMLIDRGLIEQRGTTYLLAVYFDGDASNEPYYVQFEPGNLGGPDITGDGNGDWLESGLLSKAFPPKLRQQGVDTYRCKFRLLPSPMPSEEPRILPQGTVVDVGSSVGGGVPLAGSTGSFDIMFNAHGVVDGPLAAAGLIHLVIADARDVERGFSMASPYVDVAPADGTADDSDGDGKPDERQGEVRIVSLRTQTGSAYASSLHPDFDPISKLYTDPFYYAINGGEAK